MYLVAKSPCLGEEKTLKKNTVIFAMGRRIGRVEGNVFHKTIKPGWYLEKPPAIALDVQSLIDAELAGAERVQIRDAVTGVIYKADIERIHEAGFEIDRGHGRQYALVLSAWEKEGELSKLEVITEKIKRDVETSENTDMQSIMFPDLFGV